MPTITMNDSPSRGPETLAQDLTVSPTVVGQDGGSLGELSSSLMFATNKFSFALKQQELLIVKRATGTG